MPEIQKVRWHHDAMIDLMIAEPSMSQGELAQKMGYTQTWVSIIVNSDAFKERLAERKEKLVDPMLKASVEERLDGAAKRALDKLIERLDTNAPFKNEELISLTKLAVGDRSKQPTVSQSLYVIQAPAQAKSTSEWVEMVQEAKVLPGPPLEAA